MRRRRRGHSTPLSLFRRLTCAKRSSSHLPHLSIDLLTGRCPLSADAAADLSQGAKRPRDGAADADAESADPSPKLQRTADGAEAPGTAAAASGPAAEAALPASLAALPPSGEGAGEASGVASRVASRVAAGVASRVELEPGLQESVLYLCELRDIPGTQSSDSPHFFSIFAPLSPHSPHSPPRFLRRQV